MTLFTALQEGEREVCGDFAKFREILCRPENIRIQVSGNILDNLAQPIKPWVEIFLPKHLVPLPHQQNKYLDALKEIPYSSELLTEHSKTPEQVLDSKKKNKQRICFNIA